jgi:hypothetical protein
MTSKLLLKLLRFRIRGIYSPSIIIYNGPVNGWSKYGKKQIRNALEKL